MRRGSARGFTRRLTMWSWTVSVDTWAWNEATSRGKDSTGQSVWYRVGQSGKSMLKTQFFAHALRGGGWGGGVIFCMYYGTRHSGYKISVVRALASWRTTWAGMRGGRRTLNCKASGWRMTYVMMYTSGQLLAELGRVLGFVPRGEASAGTSMKPWVVLM